MRQGISEYLVSPLTVPQVIDTVSGLYVDPTSAPIGRSIAFTGAKGGVGSSTLAHNVAWCISERMEHDVTLVDLDLPFGTAGLDFNEDPSQGVADALMDPDRLDDQLLDRLLVKCSEHLSLFSAPGSLERDFALTIPAFDSILDTVRGSVPCMIVDLPHMWEPWSRHILMTADEIVITATPDLASLRNTKNLVDTLNQARQNDEPPRLVLNQVGVPKRPEIPVKDFAEAIGSEVALVLPHDPQLFGTASNNGQMIGDLKPDSKPAVGITELSKILTNRDIISKDVSALKKFWNQLLGK
jgi:pilus assembly protein CpaE